MNKNIVNQNESGAFASLKSVSILLPLVIIFIIALLVRTFQLDHTFTSSDNCMLAERVVKNQGFLWMLMEQYGILISLCVKLFVSAVALTGKTVTEFWWVLPIAITGTMGIPLVYLFLKRLKVSSVMSMIGALLTAILPVHIFQSRYLWGYEVFGSIFMTIALWALFNFYDEMTKKRAVIASVLCGIYIISHGYFVPFAPLLLFIIYIFSPRGKNFRERFLNGLGLFIRRYLWAGMALSLPLTVRPLIHMFAKRTKFGFYLFDHMPGFVSSTGIFIALFIFSAIIIYALRKSSRSKEASVLLAAGFLYLAPLIFMTPVGITVVNGYMLISIMSLLMFSIIVYDRLFQEKRIAVTLVLFVFASLTLWGVSKAVFIKGPGCNPALVVQERGEIYDPGTKAAGYLVQKYVPAESSVYAMHKAIEEPNMYYYFRRKDYAYDDLTAEKARQKLMELKDRVDVVICSKNQIKDVEKAGIYLKRVELTDETGGYPVYIYAKESVPLPVITATFTEYNRLFDKEYSWNKEILEGFFAHDNRSFGKIIEDSYKKPKEKELIKKYLNFLY